MHDYGWDDTPVVQTNVQQKEEDEKPKRHKDRDTDVQPKKHKVLPNKPEDANMNPPAPRKDPDAEPTKTDDDDDEPVDSRTIGRKYDSDGREILTPEELAAMRKHMGDKAQPPAAVPDPEPEQVDVPVAPLTDVLNGDSRTEHTGADGVVEHSAQQYHPMHIYQFQQPKHFEAPVHQQPGPSKSAISRFEHA